jgi:sporulation protein YlmC with PRC-barrel domain
MNLIHDVLDKQVLDRNRKKLGKVDGMVLVFGKGPPRVAFIEMGPVVLGRRLGARFGRLVSRLCSRVGGKEAGEPFRIPWNKVKDIGLDVEVELAIEETPLDDWQEWLRRKLLRSKAGA